MSFTKAKKSIGIAMIYFTILSCTESNVSSPVLNSIETHNITISMNLEQLTKQAESGDDVAEFVQMFEHKPGNGARGEETAELIVEVAPGDVLKWELVLS